MTVVVSFTPTGSNQTFVVPVGVTTLDVRMWGGRGGSYSTFVTKPILPGASAQLDGVLTVVPGETLTIQVGQAGRYGARFGAGGTTGLGGWPDGGNGGVMVPGFTAAGGGGSSRIWRGGVGGTLLAVVGGGGGLGYSDGSMDEALGYSSPRGDAGTPTPADGGRTSYNGVSLTVPGSGATSLAGGSAGGTGATGGSSLQGGNGASGSASPFLFAGGGGGGGLYGGGGAGKQSKAGSLLIGNQGGGGSSGLDISSWSSVSWSKKGATGGGISESLYLVQQGGLVRFTYIEPPVFTGGWSLGIVKLMG